MNLVLGFGRFNPPHLGHKLLVDKIESISKETNSDSCVVLSNSFDKQKNPLNPYRKLFWFNKMFPVKTILATREMFGIVQIAEHFNNYNSLTVVCGSDRIAEFTKKLNKYNHILYNYSSIKIVPSGIRNEQNSISASMLREFVKENDYEKFSMGIGCLLNKECTQELFKELQNEISELKYIKNS